MNKAEKIYKENIDDYSSEKKLLVDRIKYISYGRLVVILLLCLTDYYFYKKNNLNMIFTASVIFLVGFFIFIFFHNKLFNKKRYLEVLININENGIKRCNVSLGDIEDGGLEYLDENHNFINDLDIFGENSLFKLVNTTVTKMGRSKLAEMLKLNNIPKGRNIALIQEAAKELSNKLSWRQRFISEGAVNDSVKTEIADFISWSKRKDTQSPLRVSIACTFIFITFMFIGAAVYGIIPQTFIILVLMVNYAVLHILSKSMIKELNLFDKIKKSIGSYSKMFELIENEKFEAKLLNEFKEKLLYNNDKFDKDGYRLKTSCTREMKEITNLLQFISDSVYNDIYIIINILFFSNVFLMWNLEKWRDRNRDRLEIWFEVLAQFDYLNSISNLYYEHDEWSIPSIVHDENSVSAVKIAHPLLGEKAVKNSFELKENQKTALITGSNMSGKSTFLRTVGINLVLSYIGAPVCAEKFSCKIMNIYTCMRTKDNLEESISSFYAEILRIKLLIDACRKGEKVFFILDEIFKGTNSKDRHTGAVVLIEQLMKYGASGLVSTHDLELCDLEEKNSHIVNYNFREFYEDSKIKFDYILRKGKSTTQNAVHLMKLAGIEIE